jgi:tellurite resistance protein
MGLLTGVLPSTTQKKPTDDVLLLHSMMLMANVDGVVEGEECATLEAFVNTLPEFKDADFDEQMEQAQRLAAKFKDAKDSVRALADISSDAVRKKAFVLACDIALSSGDIDEAEEELLQAMQRILGIDDGMARNIIGVLALKYMT